MNIGITQRITINQFDEVIDTLEHRYLEYWQAFGVQVIPIPNTLTNISNFIKAAKIERIVLSGGGKVHYQKKDLSEVEKRFLARDTTEADLVKYALQQSLPVLGICRGMQFLNIYFGGSLVDPIAPTLKQPLQHVRSEHPLQLSDPQLSEFGSPIVNSFHEAGFGEKHLGRDLQVFAKTEDGVVEGLYHTFKPLAAIMWHPERMKLEHSFNKFLIIDFLEKKGFWL